ncbi:high-affinity Zn(2+) transporter ZRT1 [Sugiyamaella lignohabitans]|uniref:High-affinity Zn(2+) transporter ZRT1 n=1 Tax=Sugiyamaella lignohabitans TaxID=796027 RepID=A0A167F4R5_9ASCO|nr:high-affinity Zn(2+) transporter ZRT1 [Sugiyamaella lignohabitans]ANB14822.1 high-affinity Zn(2+) transporter ZRT1 [Sugiyamaella lignohabitans]
MGLPPAWSLLDPNTVTVGNASVDDAWKVCVIDGVYFGGNDYNGSLGARISSIFVILFVSTACTLFPVIASDVKGMRVPEYVYLFAKNFGTGVIVTTAFVHLMDPAYGEIGPNTCVGMSGNWAEYSWVPAIILVTVFIIFLVDLISDVYVERRYGISHNHDDDLVHSAIVQPAQPSSQVDLHSDIEAHHNHGHTEKEADLYSYPASKASSLAEKDFQTQIAAFLILEFGVIFHSVMIGINLGATGDEFKTLYIVLIFHQSFEGLGIGARLSAIQGFPKKWWKYALCLAYGLTTPVCVAIGLGVRTAYDGNSYNANIIQGVLDSISAGILIYTGLVELLARDYIFNENRTKDLKKLTFSIIFILMGAGLMALLGKWA